jgi:hypothetical protein
VLDTRVVTLAAFPAERNSSALIGEFCLRRLVECWASPSIVDEYCHVVAEEPDFLAEFLAVVEICYPLAEIHAIGHEPDNRFLECALATGADFPVTVNIAPWHFEQKQKERQGSQNDHCRLRSHGFPFPHADQDCRPHALSHRADSPLRRERG